MTIYIVLTHIVINGPSLLGLPTPPKKHQKLPEKQKLSRVTLIFKGPRG